MIRAVAALSVLLVLGAAVSYAETKNQNLSHQDKKFLREASSGGMAEVRLGELAQQDATNASVKEFGKRMVTDHGRANDELTKLAQQNGWEMPKQMDHKDRKTVDHLSKMSGTQFDTHYMNDMVHDHMKDVAAFQQEAQNGTNPQLKDYASRTLPILQEHLRMAKDIQSRLGTGTGAGGMSGH